MMRCSPLTNKLVTCTPDVRTQRYNLFTHTHTLVLVVLVDAKASNKNRKEEV